MTRVETNGSMWLIDEDAKRYCRFPKEEKPRENGWGGADQGPLQDAVWHDFDSWWIDEGSCRLGICLPFEPGSRAEIISAPNAQVVS